MLKSLFRPRISVTPLYDHLVTMARAPWLYRDLGVPDTIWGRLEMIHLHVFIGLSGFDDSVRADREYVDAFFHHMFKRDLDQAMRELGVGDLGVSRRIKRIAEDYNGRATVYHAATAEGAEPGALEAALARNVYAGQEPPEGATTVLARYARQGLEAVRQAERADILAGHVSWPEPVF